MTLSPQPLPDGRERAHAWIFLGSVFGLLLFFVAVPGLTLTGIADQFRGRKALVETFTAFRYAVGDRLFNNTLVGKDGWLYYNGGLSYREYQRTDRFAERDLRLLRVALDQVNSRLAAEGKTLLLVIPPNKTSIYPQFMPDEIPVLGQQSRLDQFMAYMREHSTTRILDLRPALVGPSATQQTYYRTDSHWNNLGAFYASQAILAELAKVYPSVQPHPLSDYKLLLANTVGQTDLPQSMGYLSLPETAPVLEPRFPVLTHGITENLADGTELHLITTQDTSLPRLLIFSDSFYGGLQDFLQPEFSKVVDLPYWAIRGGTLTDWVAYASPDIVIIECVERNLEDLFPVLEGQGP